MTKEEKDLAIALYIKSCDMGSYLTDKNIQHSESRVKDAIDRAELFYRVLNKERPPIYYMEKPPEGFEVIDLSFPGENDEA